MRMRMRKTYLLVFTLFALAIPSYAATKKEKRYKLPLSRSEQIVPHQILSGRHFWVQAGPESSFPNLYGLKFGAGYQSKFLAVDLRWQMGAGEYQAFYTEPDEAPDDAEAMASTSDPTSEMNRPRTLEDAWSFWRIETGIGVRAHLFPSWLPLLTEKARFGLGLGGFMDRKNSLGFKGYTWSFEASLQQQLGYKSKFGIELAGTWHVGWAVSSERPTLTGRIPVTWVTTSLGFLFWF